MLSSIPIIERFKTSCRVYQERDLDNKCHTGCWNGKITKMNLLIYYKPIFICNELIEFCNKKTLIKIFKRIALKCRKPLRTNLIDFSRINFTLFYFPELIEDCWGKSRHARLHKHSESSGWNQLRWRQPGRPIWIPGLNTQSAEITPRWWNILTAFWTVWLKFFSHWMV